MRYADRSSCPLAVALACALLAPRFAATAELRPYSLPSQQQQQIVRPLEAPIQLQIQTPAQTQAPVQIQTPSRPAPSLGYYQDYADWARQLKPGQRAELARGFERDARLASTAGRDDEARHYRRLVTILRSPR